MKLLTPLGLLGLIAIAILILIYIIRPNYQQKFISSTFVWKLSLKYRKKRIPTSKLRNILLIVCQVLILAGCAAILAQPNLVKEEPVDETEVIAILDSSASMRTETDETSRFERAVNGVMELTEDMFAKDGIVSVILADSKATFLAQRYTTENKTALLEKLNELIEDEQIDCSYGSADIEGAITLCEDILKQNSETQIKIYTDTTYEYVPEGIEIVKVIDEKEWNAGILDAYAAVEDNYYSFYVDVARYGSVEESAEAIMLELEVQGANALDGNDQTGRQIVFSLPVYCNNGETQRVVFINDNKYVELYEANDTDDDGVEYYPISQSDWIYSYQSIFVSLEVEDSFQEDDVFNIYNGQKEVIKVQYASSLPNSFVNAALSAIKKAYSKLNLWDVQITEVKVGTEPALEGFDFYIFEHSMPDSLPVDGVVFLINPGSSPSNAGFRIASDYDFRKESVPLTQARDHKILEGIATDKITVSKYKQLQSFDGDYVTLLECNSDPILLVKDTADSKVAVLNFSLHFSNLPILGNFPVLVYNMFEYFIPATVKSNAFEVYEEVSLNARGESLKVSCNGVEVNTFKEFPAIMSVSTPGTYEFTQTTAFGKKIYERIFVKIPAVESNIWEKQESLPELYRESNFEDYLQDLMFYIAAAMVVFLFIEWWLQSRDTM